ncbi:MAG: CoA-binding protein [Ignavibacteriae bacterium]|nr:CoA-binding protein [Ignavibacteriota bacterium]MCB9258777.1 CoA-binding protein [Ignavibacteriales bacterium]
MTSKKAIQDFFTNKNYAVVGVSRKSTKFGNAIYKEFKKKGINVYGVNPNMESFEGDKCYGNLKELQGKIDAVINVVSPLQTLEVVRAANEIGVKNIWMQQGSESDEAIEYCKEKGINEVHKECVLMFTEPVKSIHKVHKWIWKVVGKLPN